MIISIFSLLLTARIFGWLLDRISVETWYKVLDEKDLKAFTKKFQKWDGFYFRVNMYANTYLIFALTVALAAIFGAMELIEENTRTSPMIDTTFAEIIAAVSIGVYIPYQMLTHESKYSNYIFIFILVATIAFAVNY